MSDIMQAVSKVTDSLINSSLSLFSSSSAQKGSADFNSLSFNDTFQQECGKNDFSQKGGGSAFSIQNASEDSYSKQDSYSIEEDDSGSSWSWESDKNSEQSVVEADSRKAVEPEKEKVEAEDSKEATKEEKAVDESKKDSEKPKENKDSKEDDEDTEKAVAENESEKEADEPEGKNASKETETGEKAEQAQEDEELEKALSDKLKSEKSQELGAEENLEIKKTKDIAESDSEEEAASLDTAKAQAVKEEAKSINDKIQEAVKSMEDLQKELKEPAESLKEGNSSLTENVMRSVANNKRNSSKGELAQSKNKSAEDKLAKFAETGKEADVKVKKMTFENNNASGESNSDPKELLRTLMNKSRRDIGRDNLDESQLSETKGVELKETKNVFGEMVKNNTEAGTLLKNSSKIDIVKDKGPQIFADAAKSSNAATAKPISQTQHVIMDNISVDRGVARMMTQGAVQTTPSGSSSNIALVQELVARMQGMLRGSNMDSGAKLSMDFEVGKWGEMSMTLQQKNGSLSVSLEVGNDASREQLMNQRDEMEQNLRQMGYKDVVFDVSGKGSDNQNNGSQKKQHKQGNESIENVKLAGNDKEDMAQVLSGAFMS